MEVYGGIGVARGREHWGTSPKNQKLTGHATRRVFVLSVRPKMHLRPGLPLPRPPNWWGGGSLPLPKNPCPALGFRISALNSCPNSQEYPPKTNQWLRLCMWDSGSATVKLGRMKWIVKRYTGCSKKTVLVPCFNFVITSVNVHRF